MSIAVNETWLLATWLLMWTTLEVTPFVVTIFFRALLPNFIFWSLSIYAKTSSQIASMTDRHPTSSTHAVLGPSASLALLMAEYTLEYCGCHKAELPLLQWYASPPRGWPRVAMIAVVIVSIFVAD